MPPFSEMLFNFGGLLLFSIFYFLYFCKQIATAEGDFQLLYYHAEFLDIYAKCSIFLMCY